MGGGRPARCGGVRVPEPTGSTPAGAWCKTWHLHGHTDFVDIGEAHSKLDVRENRAKRKEPASGRGKGIPGFFEKWNIKRN